MIRIKPLVAAVSCAASLNAVADIQRMFVLGDSLSDGGAFTQPINGVLQLNGVPANVIPQRLSFVNNQPGTDSELWVDVLASELGLNLDADILNGVENSGSQVAAPIDLNGGNYAQGGARVTQANSNVQYDSTFTPPGGRSADEYNVTQLPLSTQIDRLLADVTSLNKDDLVVVWIGANDVFQQAADIGTATIDATTGGLNMITAANEAGAQLDRLIAAGAENIVAVTIPDMGTTPAAVLQGPAAAAGLTALSGAFNSTFIRLASSKGALVIDSGKLLNAVINDPERYGFDAATAMTPICETSTSSLSCIQGVTDTTTAVDRIFADTVHPSLQSHQLFGQAAIASLQTVPFAASMGYSAHQAVQVQVQELRDRIGSTAVLNSGSELQVTPFVSTTSYELEAGQSSKKVDSSALAKGVMIDSVMNGATLVGLSISAGSDTAKSLGKVDSSATHFSVYGMHRFGDDMYARGLVSFGSGSVSAKRQVVVGAATETNSGDTDSGASVIEFGVGTVLQMKDWVVEPSVDLSMASTSVKAFAENDAPTSVSFGIVDVESTQVIVGAKGGRSLDNGWDLSLGVSLVNELNDDDIEVAVGTSLDRLAYFDQEARDGSFARVNASVSKALASGRFSAGLTSVIGADDQSSTSMSMAYSIDF